MRDVELEESGHGNDGGLRRDRDYDRAQAIVDRRMPPLPYHPAAIAFGVFAVAAIALRLSGDSAGSVGGVPLVVGFLVYAAGALWERQRERELRKVVASMGRVG